MPIFSDYLLTFVSFSLCRYTQSVAMENPVLKLSLDLHTQYEYERTQVGDSQIFNLTCNRNSMSDSPISKCEPVVFRLHPASKNFNRSAFPLRMRNNSDLRL
jgi:hypothetical protein